MYCRKCGEEATNEEYCCPRCGTSLYPTTSNQEYDGNSIGLNILSFLLPIVGFILYLVWQGSHPVKAKGCGIWALVSFTISVLYYTL